MSNQGGPGPEQGAQRKWLSPTQALTRFAFAAPIDGPANRDDRSEARRSEARYASSPRYGFRVGSIGLLLAPDKLSEVVVDQDVYPIPTTPIWFSGLINLRGNLVPVFDLKRLFGMEEDAGRRPSLLVVDRGDKAVATPLDTLPQAICTDHPLRQLPPVPSLLQDHVRAAYVQGNDVWLDFDFDQLFEAVGARMLD